MIKVGLTGGIGSGKTLVARIFEVLGIPVFYADKESKNIMISNQKIKSDIIEIFGELSYSGNILNRKYLAEKIFNNKDLINRLNAIIHPAVHNQFLKWVENYKEYPYIIEEAAILFESGANKYFDYTILVKANEVLRIQRVMKRDKISKEHVISRMNNQMSDNEKSIMADYEIENDIDSMVLPQVLEINEKLISLHKKINKNG